MKEPFFRIHADHTFEFVGYYENHAQAEALNRGNIFGIADLYKIIQEAKVALNTIPSPIDS